MREKMLSEAKLKDKYIVTERVLKFVPVRYREVPSPASIVNSFDAAQDLLGNLFDSEPYEVIFAIALDSSNRFLGFVKVAEGTVNQAKLYLRKILTFLLCEANATGLILAHNHPGGSALPSREDIILTERLSQRIKDIEVRLLDHIIYIPGGFGKDPEWVSMLSMGHLPE